MTSRASARGAALIRQVANRTAKLRLQRDAASLRQDKLPRAFAIITGEDQPTVASAERRTIYVRFDRGDIPVDQLKALSRSELVQARPGLTAALAKRVAAMMPTNHWLVEQRDYYAEYLIKDHDATDGTTVGRANNVAQLATGMKFMLDTAVREGAISRDEAAERWHQAWQATPAMKCFMLWMLKP